MKLRELFTNFLKEDILENNGNATIHGENYVSELQLLSVITQSEAARVLAKIDPVAQNNVENFQYIYAIKCN